MQCQWLEVSTPATHPPLAPPSRPTRAFESPKSGRATHVLGRDGMGWAPPPSPSRWAFELAKKNGPHADDRRCALPIRCIPPAVNSAGHGLDATCVLLPQVRVPVLLQPPCNLPTRISQPRQIPRRTNNYGPESWILSLSLSFSLSLLDRANTGDHEGGVRGHCRSRPLVNQTQWRGSGSQMIARECLAYSGRLESEIADLLGSSTWPALDTVLDRSPG
jgi:hypothetical protein